MWGWRVGASGVSPGQSWYPVRLKSLWTACGFEHGEREVTVLDMFGGLVYRAGARQVSEF